MVEKWLSKNNEEEDEFICDTCKLVVKGFSNIYPRTVITQENKVITIQQCRYCSAGVKKLNK